MGLFEEGAQYNHIFLDADSLIPFKTLAGQVVCHVFNTLHTRMAFHIIGKTNRSFTNEDKMSCQGMPLKWFGDGPQGHISRVFQNFVVPWKINISQKLILPAEASGQDPI